MAISIFPSTAAEFVSNNFVVDMNDSTNNTADTGGVKQAGPYSMSFSSGDTSFDVYLIDDEGNSVGYANTTSIVATGLFTTVVIFGVAQDEVISFTYQGSVNNADGEGDEPGAGAYLESISPTDLPSIDDTATVTGGNFGADTEITFESGATVLPAKSVTIVSGTELLVTRPDGLVEDDAPYTLRAVTTGVPQPTGSNPHILVDEITAGSDPTWVTTSPLNQPVENTAFSQTLEATDAEGTITDYSVTTGSLPTGLTLNSTTGVISGTPTTEGTETFTVTVTDDGGNTTPKQFEMTVQGPVFGGTQTSDSTHIYHTFTESDTLTVNSSTSVEYLLVAGGGGAISFGGFSNGAGGGGGAGGLLDGTTTLSVGSYSVVVGAGGGSQSQGSNSTFDGLTAIGGGSGGGGSSGGGNGGSGGGGSRDIAGNAGGDGTAGQGFDGGFASFNGTYAGSGGGAGEGGEDKTTSSATSFNRAGDGKQFTAYANATGLDFDGGYFAGGGGGGVGDSNGGNNGGLGGGGNGAFGPFQGPLTGSQAGAANSGGGGGGFLNFGSSGTPRSSGKNGGSGVLIIRRAI